MKYLDGKKQNNNNNETSFCERMKNDVQETQAM